MPLPSAVNEHVANQIMELKKKFEEERAKIPGVEDINMQCTYGKTLEDIATILMNVEIRVDFLSEYGLTHLNDLVAAMKSINAIKYGIGGETARRIIALIKFKGNVYWKRCGKVLKTVARTTSHGH